MPSISVGLSLASVFWARPSTNWKRRASHGYDDHACCPMPTSTVEPCIPTKGTKVVGLSGSADGYRLIAMAKRVRLNGVIDKLSGKGQSRCL